MCAVSSSTPEDTSLSGRSMSLAQCMPASRTNSEIPSSTSKAASPDHSGEGSGEGSGTAAVAAPHQATVSPTPVRDTAPPSTKPSAKQSPKQSPKKQSPCKPRAGVAGGAATAARAQRSAAASDSTAAGRTACVRIAGSVQHRQRVTGLQSRATGAAGSTSTSRGPQSGGPKAAAASLAARRGVASEVRGIPVPSRAGNKSPGPNVNLQRANMRLQETLNLSATSSAAESAHEGTSRCYLCSNLFCLISIHIQSSILAHCENLFAVGAMPVHVCVRARGLCVCCTLPPAHAALHTSLTSRD